MQLDQNIGEICVANQLISANSRFRCQGTKYIFCLYLACSFVQLLGCEFSVISVPSQVSDSGVAILAVVQAPEYSWLLQSNANMTQSPQGFRKLLLLDVSTLPRCFVLRYSLV